MSNELCECGEWDFSHDRSGDCLKRQGRFKAVKRIGHGCIDYRPSQEEMIRDSERRLDAALFELRMFRLANLKVAK